jgi:hypothetical protein
MRDVAQRLPARPEIAGDRHEYAFLVGGFIDRATLERARQEAAQTGVAPHDVLLAHGWVGQADYATALARSLGVEAALGDLAMEAVDAGPEGQAEERGLPALLRGQACRVLCASQEPPAAVGRRVIFLRAQGLRVVLAPRMAIDAACEDCERSGRMERAVRGLLRERPALSAGSRAKLWQVLAAACTVGAAIGGFFVYLDATLAALTGLIALPFFCVTLLRLVALLQVFAKRPAAVGNDKPYVPRSPDHALPVYSIMVPLLREENVLPDLVRSLRALDYPAAKLDIMLVLEAGDVQTQAGLLALELPGNFRTVAVPLQPPQTKPKALNYALQVARGDFVVVYDAEDRPEPDQLRRALDVFADAPPELVCVQAQLNIYNPQRSWLTRGIMA